jgi:hypothetical protein
MDALSDALCAVKLGGAVYLTAEFSAPWCVEGRVDAVLFAACLPIFKRLIAYHLVLEGSLHAQIGDDDTSAIEVFAERSWSYRRARRIGWPAPEACGPHRSLRWRRTRSRPVPARS